MVLLPSWGERASVVEVLLVVELRHGVDALGRRVDASAQRGSPWAMVDSLRREKTIEISGSLTGGGRHVDVELLFVLREETELEDWRGMQVSVC
jgi:hypothetical protein